MLSRTDLMSKWAGVEQKKREEEGKKGAALKKAEEGEKLARAEKERVVADYEKAQRLVAQTAEMEKRKVAKDAQELGVRKGGAEGGGGGGGRIAAAA